MDFGGNTGAAITILMLVTGNINCYVRMMVPLQRSSLWRRGEPGAERNIKDGLLNCGGFETQWVKNTGCCGVCGDACFSTKHHEHGGKYVKNIISASYKQGDIIQVTITRTHKQALGYFEFRICEPPRNAAVVQQCLDKNVLKIQESDQDTKFYPGSGGQSFQLNVLLPPGLYCSRCVLQFKYNTGYRYPDESTGCDCLGCGKQEQYYNCADVSIKKDPNYVSPNVPSIVEVQTPLASSMTPVSSSFIEATSSTLTSSPILAANLISSSILESPPFYVSSFSPTTLSASTNNQDLCVCPSLVTTRTVTVCITETSYIIPVSSSSEIRSTITTIPITDVELESTKSTVFTSAKDLVSTIHHIDIWKQYIISDWPEEVYDNTFIERSSIKASKPLKNNTVDVFFHALLDMVRKFKTSNYLNYTVFDRDINDALNRATHVCPVSTVTKTIINAVYSPLTSTRSLILDPSTTVFNLVSLTGLSTVITNDLSIATNTTSVFLESTLSPTPVLSLTPLSILSTSHDITLSSESMSNMLATSTFLVENWSSPWVTKKYSSENRSPSLVTLSNENRSPSLVAASLEYTSSSVVLTTKIPQNKSPSPSHANRPPSITESKFPIGATSTQSPRTKLSIPCLPTASNYKCFSIYKSVNNKWCNNNCPDKFCPNYLCICDCTDLIMLPTTPKPRKVCLSIRAGIDDIYCSKNCAIGFCPKEYCKCVILDR